MCFSATIAGELKYMLDKHLADAYEQIKIHKEALVTELNHAFLQTEESHKLEQLEQYLLQRSFGKVLVFAQTKKSVGILEKTLRITGYEVVALHGDIDQYERIKTMKAFKSSHKIILVATDVASRGLNLQNVDLVVNYDIPQDSDDYVHRVGRTARAGQSGEAIMFVTSDELQKLRRLERANKIEVKQIDIDGNEIARKSFTPRSGSNSRTGGYRNRFAYSQNRSSNSGNRSAGSSSRYRKNGSSSTGNRSKSATSGGYSNSRRKPSSPSYNSSYRASK